MKIYADFLYYIEQYCGNMIKDQQSFNKVAREASLFIDQHTLGRIKEPVDEVRLATCAISEVIYDECKQRTEDQIISETVGPHSVSYAKKVKNTEEYTREKMKLLRMYLANTGLLYRGITSCSS